MTQLFDTTTYDDTDDEVVAATVQTGATGRHLRSVSFEHDTELGERRVDWQLDPATIEIGRRGIAKARAALRDSAKGRPVTRRKAA